MFQQNVSVENIYVSYKLTIKVFDEHLKYGLKYQTMKCNDQTMYIVQWTWLQRVFSFLIFHIFYTFHDRSGLWNSKKQKC